MHKRYRADCQVAKLILRSPRARPSWNAAEATAVNDELSGLSLMKRLRDEHNTLYNEHLKRSLRFTRSVCIVTQCDRLLTCKRIRIDLLASL